MHYDAQHSLIDCWLFENLCHDVGAAVEFNSVRTDLGLGPMRERPDYRNNRPTNTPTPYPPRTQPSARRVTQSANRYDALGGQYDTEVSPPIEESTNTDNTSTQQDNDTNNHLKPPLSSMAFILPSPPFCALFISAHCATLLNHPLYMFLSLYPLNLGLAHYFFTDS